MTKETNEPVTSSRNGKVLLTAIKEAYKKWKTIKPEETEVAAREFLLLYCELQTDTKIRSSERKQWEKKLRQKLSTLSKQISKMENEKITQQRKDALESAKEFMLADAEMKNVKKPDSVKLPDDKSKITAQFNRRGNWNQGNQNFDDNDRGKIGGEELVNLIQTTIHPQSWEANGGEGTIYYWRTHRHLIIYQTEEVHRDVSNVLEQLRR
ncbi:MAG: hypothetical protein Q4C96_00670 [Planctomycetia bacterium]|nr:hypothetical protein [Planctomycetia bacterium]